MYKKNLHQFWQTIIANKEIILIVLLATVLRTWNLNTQMIFFGDAAHDVTVAMQSVQTGSIPLQGIASSVPRFHQGPLTIWMEMLVNFLFGSNLLFEGFFFALLSILAVIFLYELLVIHADKRTALISAFSLAVLPLAVANGRTPYHTTPIPLFLGFYFFGLMQLWQKKKYGVFWAVLSFCLLFQFELAVTPLFLLIPYVCWRQKWKPIANVKRTITQFLAALVLGLLPQIIYDLTHSFAQMGGFAVWTAYRIVAFFGYKQVHAFSWQHFVPVITSYQTYLMRTWGGENRFLFLICLLVLLVGCGAITWRLLKHKHTPIIIELVLFATIIQTLAYVVHGSPSEAYFPPFFILTATIVGYALNLFSHYQKIPHSFYLVSLGLFIFATYNVAIIWQHHFFVDAQYQFNYGYGIGEQRQIVNLIARETKGKYRLRTLQAEGKFENYFANLRLLLAQKRLTEDQQNGQTVYIEPKSTDFPKIVSYTRASFPSVDVYFIN